MITESDEKILIKIMENVRGSGEEYTEVWLFCVHEWIIN